MENNTYNSIHENEAEETKNTSLNKESDYVILSAARWTNALSILLLAIWGAGVVNGISIIPLLLNNNNKFWFQLPTMYFYIFIFGGIISVFGLIAAMFLYNFSYHLKRSVMQKNESETIQAYKALKKYALWFIITNTILSIIGAIGGYMISKILTNVY